MFVTVVEVRVKPEHVDDFIEASQANHEQSVQEPGNLRFDVLQAKEDPCRFLLYEAYGSADEAAAHKKTAHYRTWRETVADWMAEPRRGTTFEGVFPRVRSGCK